MSSQEPKVAVNILCWHGYEQARTCIESLVNLDYENIHIILTNNGPRDAETIASGVNCSSMTIVDHDSNVGFATGHNEAATVAREENAEYIFFLNNDTTVGKTCISTLVAAAENADKGLYAPKVLRKPDMDSKETEFEFIAGYFDWSSGTPHSYGSEVEEGAKEIPQPLTQEKIDYMHGAALFTELATFSELGGFEDRFFIYYEDADIGQRAKAKGIRLHPVEEAVVFHIKEGNIDMPEYEDVWGYLNLRNKFWFMARHADRQQFSRFAFSYLFMLLPKQLGDGVLNKRRLSFIFATLSGVLAAVTFTQFREEKLTSRADRAVRERIQNDEI